MNRDTILLNFLRDTLASLYYMDDGTWLVCSREIEVRRVSIRAALKRAMEGHRQMEKEKLA